MKQISEQKKSINERNRQIFDMRLETNLNCKQIAEIFGICPQNVHKIIRRVSLDLFKNDPNNHIFKKEQVEKYVKGVKMPYYKISAPRLQDIYVQIK